MDVATGPSLSLERFISTRKEITRTLVDQANYIVGHPVYRLRRRVMKLCTYLSGQTCVLLASKTILTLSPLLRSRMHSLRSTRECESTTL
jgi:hypothetical protein